MSACGVPSSRCARPGVDIKTHSALAMRQAGGELARQLRQGKRYEDYASPDLADALALTFAYPVAPHDHRWQLTGKPRQKPLNLVGASSV